MSAGVTEPSGTAVLFEARAGSGCKVLWSSPCPSYMSARPRGLPPSAAHPALRATVMARFTRVRDLSSELMRQIALGPRKRPPSETMHRLQLELPLWAATAANDAQPPRRKPPKQQGPRKPRPHGRVELPEHLEREVLEHLVPSERLDIEPASFIVRQERMEMRACRHCHDCVAELPEP